MVASNSNRKNRRTTNMQNSEMLKTLDLKTLFKLREDSIREILGKEGLSRNLTRPATDAPLPEQKSVGSKRKEHSGAVESD